MRYLAIFLLVLTLAMPAFAGDAVPFGGEINSNIKNYNRETTKLATSGALGDGAVKELAKKGFKTIIDLRTKAEGTASEKESVEKASMAYFNIPVTGKGVNDKQLAEFTKIFESAKGPVLLHCASANRAGAMLTRYYLSKGMARGAAFERGRAIGIKPSLEATIK
jgi:uncharacterized protein (TIGR01244 family)